MEPERRADTTSQIAQERIHPERATWGYVLGVAGLALAFTALAIAVGTRPTEATPGETAASFTPAGLSDSFGLHPARLASAVAGGITIAAVVAAARRLLHSNAAGILAGVLLALDPSMLAFARLAVPTPIALAGLAVALACFLSPAERLPWLGGLALAIAAAAEPRALVWGIPLGLLALLRGHIYAAPPHLLNAFLQALALPAAGAALNLLATGGNDLAPDCLRIGLGSALLAAQAPDFGLGVVAVRNPALWFGGLGALLFLAGSAALALSRQFRMARLPGRIQLRLAGPLPAIYARALWLLVLATLVPFPDAWLLVFPLAVAAGIVYLSEDAPGFGIAVAVVLVVVAGIALGRAWPLVTGDAAWSGPLGLLPWTRGVDCA